MLPPAPPPPELVELRDDPIVDPDPPAPRNDQRRLVLLAPIGGWALSLALLGMIGWSAIHWRTQIQATWPPSERLYAALGLS